MYVYKQSHIFIKNVHVLCTPQIKEGPSQLSDTQTVFVVARLWQEEQEKDLRLAISVPHTSEQIIWQVLCLQSHAVPERSHFLFCEGFRSLFDKLYPEERARASL